MFEMTNIPSTTEDMSWRAGRPQGRAAAAGIDEAQGAGLALPKGKRCPTPEGHPVAAPRSSFTTSTLNAIQVGR